jgi:hypothetical protein
VSVDHIPCVCNPARPLKGDYERSELRGSAITRAWGRERCEASEVRSVPEARGALPGARDRWCNARHVTIDRVSEAN